VYRTLLRSANGSAQGDPQGDAPFTRECLLFLHVRKRGDTLAPQLASAEANGPARIRGPGRRARPSAYAFAFGFAAPTTRFAGLIARASCS
jgi:hypothetical protein